MTATPPGRMTDNQIGWWVGEEPERSNGPTLTLAQWDRVLRKTGFSGVDGSFPDSNDKLSEPALGSDIFSTAVSTESLRYPPPGLLLGRSSNSFDIEALEEALINGTGHSAKVQYLDECQTGSSDGKTLIVLALDHLSLLRLSEAQFITVQAILMRSQGVLWVTRGASGHSPEAAMIDGLTRVVRSENAGVKLVTLDLDSCSDIGDARTASLVSKVYEHVFASTSAENVQDQEFVVEDGLIKIRRVVEDVDRDQYLMRETQQPVPEAQPFVQADRNLRLKLGTPGLLDSIYFEDDLMLQQAIGNESVEVEIKATGVSLSKALHPKSAH